MGCGASLNQVHVLDERDGVVSKSGKRSHKKSKKADQFSVSSQDFGQGGSSLPSIQRQCAPHILVQLQEVKETRMWANAQRDGRPAEYRWRPLFNAAKFG